MNIDFYVLNEVSRPQGLHLVCRLIETCYLSQEKVFIHTTKEEALLLDKLLWVYREDSFIPHQLYSTSADLSIPVLIGEGELPSFFSGVIVNLHQSPISSLSSRVIEIVFSEATMQQLARERYKQYRALGYDITTHKIKANDL